LQELQGKAKGAIMGMGVKHYRKDGREHKGEYHKMPNGQLHSGKTHNKSSVRLYHYGDLSKKSQNKARKSWNV
tara:strand:- start:5069 stop:5287 length:219 start_codon:yes stop_codon:yes gene_type:complete